MFGRKYPQGTVLQLQSPRDAGFVQRLPQFDAQKIKYRTPALPEFLFRNVRNMTQDSLMALSCKVLHYNTRQIFQSPPQKHKCSTEITYSFVCASHSVSVQLLLLRGQFGEVGVEYRERCAWVL